MDKASFFVLNVFLNSFLAFFTVVFLIEGIIFLFRIPQGRLAAGLRMLPIFKLPLDLCLYDFSRWSYAQGINPLLCEEGTRSLSIMLGSIYGISDWFFIPITSGIQLTVLGNMTFTIADVIGHGMRPMFLHVLVALFILLSIVLLMRRLAFYYRSITTLNSLSKTSQLASRKMCNSILISRIKKYRLQILTSLNLKGSPFVAGLISSIVFIPNELSQNLSRKEYEAVLAHEIEHIRYKDNWIRFILDFIESIFWWIPTKWLHRRIEEGQEMGCDLKCKKYGVNPIDLASALCKSSRYTTNKRNEILTHYLTKHTIHKRINTLLQSQPICFKKGHFVFSFIAVGIAFLVIFLGKFWTF